MRRVFLLICCLALAARPAAAQTDSDWIRKPYPLKVVLHIHPHPVMTEDYIRQVRLELSAGLKQHFGGVAEINVIDASGSDLMKEVLEKGWSALDERNLVSDEKEHLIQLRFINGAYELEARQWDGFTGLCSMLRTNRTADRSWVARQATLMTVQDFGVVAELDPSSLPKNKSETGVKLRLKGWNLQDRPQALRLSRGEVFAFTRIKMDPDGKLRSERVPDALIVVTIYDDKDDFCNGVWHARYTRVNPFASDGGRTKSFRALRLGTRQAQLKLRLVNKQDGSPVTGTKVVVQRGEGADRREFPLRPDDNAPGTYESLEPFAHFAKVVVSQGSVILAEVPMPILSDEVIPLELTGTREARILAEFEYDYNQWRRPLFETIDLIDRKNPQLRDLVRRRDKQAAVQLAKELAKTLEDELDALKKRFEEVKGLATQAGPVTKAKVDEGDKYLKQLAMQLKSYQDLIQRVENPSPAQEAVDQGQRAEDAYDFEQALKSYRDSLQKDPEQPNLKKKVDAMNRAWQIKGPAHRDARKFITTDWAKGDWQQLEDKLTELQKHAPVLKESRDHLTAIVLVNLNQKHLKKLAEVQANLGNSEGDQEKLAMIKKVGEALTKMNSDLLDFYDSATK